MAWGYAATHQDIMASRKSRGHRFADEFVPASVIVSARIAFQASNNRVTAADSVLDSDGKGPEIRSVALGLISGALMPQLSLHLDISDTLQTCARRASPN